MPQLKKRSQWTTADGRKFWDRKAAVQHERWLELVDMCSAMVKAASDNGTVRAIDIASAIVDHNADLQRILRGNPSCGVEEE